MQIALTGDVMLGRLVDQYVIHNQSIGPDKIWSDVLPLLLKADRRLSNLECVISSGGREWQPDSKAFHFRAQPRAIDFLRAAKIDCVTLANNHVLDYGTDALIECLAAARSSRYQADRSRCLARRGPHAGHRGLAAKPARSRLPHG